MLLLVSLPLHAAPPAVLAILDAQPPAPRSAACEGTVEHDGVVHYRAGCTTVMSFASQAACHAWDDRGRKAACAEAWGRLVPGEGVRYHHAFGPLRPVADRDGLYLAGDGVVRIPDPGAAVPFGPLLDPATVAAEVASFGSMIDPMDYPALYPLVKDRPGFRDAFLAEVKRRALFEPVGRPYEDFYEHGMAAVMFWYWEDDAAFPMDKPLIDQMKRQVVTMDYLYSARFGGDAYQSKGEGRFGRYLKWARGYASLGARDRLRVHAIGAWPPQLRAPANDYAATLFHHQQGRLRAALGRDLRTVAREEYARGRPAVAAVLDALVATVNPIRVTGQQAELITRCDRTEGETVVRSGPRYAFAKPVWDQGLPAAVFHIDDPEMRTRLVTTTHTDTTETVLQPAKEPPAEVQREVARIQAQIEAINEQIGRWSAWNGVRGTADASVTGWSCNEATSRCTATWQGGGANSFGALVEAAGRRDTASLEARRSALYRQIDELLPPGSFAPAVVRTDIVVRDVTSTETAFDGSFVLSYRGVVRQFRGRSSWRESEVEARADAVCDAAVDAEADLDGFFLEVLGDAARAAAAEAPSADPVEQAVRAWPAPPRPEDVDAMLRAVIGEP